MDSLRGRFYLPDANLFGLDLLLYFNFWVHEILSNISFLFNRMSTV